MNICNQKGEDEAVSVFLGKSFSVYGISTPDTSGDLPEWNMTIMDYFEYIACN